MKCRDSILIFLIIKLANYVVVGLWLSWFLYDAQVHCHKYCRRSKTHTHKLWTQFSYLLVFWNLIWMFFMALTISAKSKIFFDPDINRINMNIYILIYPCNINWNLYWGQQQVVTWFNLISNNVKSDIDEDFFSIFAKKELTIRI